MNEKNLVKLSKYIFEMIADEKFNLKNFRSICDVASCNFKSKEDCGTVGCALGWAPFVKGLEFVESDFCRTGILNFYKYSNRVFEINCIIDDSWTFLFDSSWYKIDNSREGFVKRVIYLIEGGKNFKITEKHPYIKIDPNKIYDY